MQRNFTTHRRHALALACGLACALPAFALELGSDDPDTQIRLDFTPMLSPKLAETIGGVHEPADLLKLPIISPCDPWWPQWFAAVGIRNPTLIDTKLHSYEAQDLEANAAIAGYGVAIISPFFFKEELASGRLIRPFPLACPATAPIQLVYSHSRRNAPKIKAFQAWITATLEAEKVP